MITQMDLMNEKFWDFFNPRNSPILRGAAGAAGAAVKGLARTLDYVAPEITRPIHALDRAARDIGTEMRYGWRKGTGGSAKLFEQILADSGYVMDTASGVSRAGKNKLVKGWRSLGTDKTGKPIPDKKSRLLTFLFDKDNVFKIVSTETQHTSSMSKYHGQHLKPTKDNVVKGKKS